MTTYSEEYIKNKLISKLDAVHVVSHLFYTIFYTVDDKNLFDV